MIQSNSLGIAASLSDDRAAHLFAVSMRLTDLLARGAVISRRSLSTLMRQELGGSDAAGDWSMRDAYDALEVAQVRLAMGQSSSLIRWDDADATFVARDALSHQLPTQTYRSERRVDLQQFSTPLALSLLAACAAQIRASDLVLEPSAGTGMLAVHARHRGAELLLNERDDRRADLLALTFDQHVSRLDGEFIDDLLAAVISAISHHSSRTYQRLAVRDAASSVPCPLAGLLGELPFAGPCRHAHRIVPRS